MFKAFGNAFELNVALRVPKALWDLKISLLRTTSADAERQKKKEKSQHPIILILEHILLVKSVTLFHIYH